MRRAPGGRASSVDDILDTVNSTRPGEVSTPLFVAAHMKHTHPPFTLDEDCNYRNLGLSMIKGEWDDIAGYRFSIECVKKQITRLLDQIDPSAVVIIQSDHGPVDGDRHSLTSVGDPNASTFPARRVWTRAAVFSAVRLPPQCRSSISDTYAGVSTFKVVFGCLSGNHERPEPEKTFWTWYWDDVVLDVTDRLRAFSSSLS